MRSTEIPPSAGRWNFGQGRSICPANSPITILPKIVFNVLGIVAILVVFASAALAGGPKYVAGTTFFNSGTAGTPLTWSQGTVKYFTDQGNLSPILTGPTADAFVADAWNQWTSIATVAVVAVHAGQLAEDVSGANVTVNSDRTINVPADIMPSAIATPVGIVYDVDGSVTDALLGQGAGGSASCFDNAAFGGVDNFGADAHFFHALIILNGNCAQTSAQLPDVEYRLVRVMGRVLGLDWSQLNLNVITGSPRPTADDYTGFPVMHDSDSVNCVPISLCYSNNGQTSPYVPKMDDQAALARLYPVTSQNSSGFPGKQLSAQNTARIHGNVYFENASGQAGQGMQGVNVVARMIDPSTGLPSRAFAATSISGFLFTGNAGNTVSGPNDSTGQPFTNFGAVDPTVEGFFDLSGLQIPNGAQTAQYQLSIEAVDPLWSQEAGPYGPIQVIPSGTFQPIIVSVTLGGDTTQDILMQNSGVAKMNWFGPTAYVSPAPLPAGGDWTGSLNAYGETDYFSLNGQSNRTLSVIVSAIDEFGAAVQNKIQPVAGMWALSDPGTFPAPAETPSAFNTTFFGETRLDATLLQSTAFRVGISDYRGDGRPDFRYHARVFYGDNIFPARASVAGNTPIAIQGLGFLSNISVGISAANPPLEAISARQILINTPPMADGIRDVVLSDASTGASSTMTGVLTYGAGPTDIIALLPGPNPAIPVGGQLVNPIRVQVLADDGKTPVPGASVFLTSAPAVAFSACSGRLSCTVLSDQSGQVATGLTVLTQGAITITAQLAPASYANPQQVQTTVVGRSTALDISLSSSFAFIAQGATLNLPITARVLSNGSPIGGKAVNYFVMKGSGTLSSSTVNADSNGLATTTLELAALSGDVEVSACIAPGNAPCQIWSAVAVPLSALNIQPVSGDVQVVAVGNNFAPFTVRVTDQATPPDPVLGASVFFQSLVGRSRNNEPILWIAQSGISQPTIPIILAQSQATVSSDSDGLASVQPTASGIDGAVLVVGSASVATSTLDFQLQSLLPVK
ncbi:MAG: IPT/TIG domain-containing protein [Terriglobales bacterium]